MKRLIRPLALIALLAAQPALAWGDYAHRLTARIAAAQLTSQARGELRRLLRAAPRLGTPSCPLNSLEDASVWPDCVRALPDGRFGYTAPWHYQNISVCGDFDVGAKCPNGDCVTVQVARQQALLADRARPAAERLQALAFLVHFTGDMHQPLHIGDKGDRGGNDVKAAFGFKATQFMNLHRVWDSDLAERALTEPPAITPFSITPAQRRQWTRSPAATRIADWARAGWQISRDLAYGGLPDVPDACTVTGAGRVAMITPAYVSAATPAVRGQVGRAGTRIAQLLNEALATPVSTR
ncbi:S1/P1 nuclease [Sandarakinorhabdus oryzae]|uniref:S1/P1 nuclease n=1 Tax=Sandarakinorhabdus oryzae TaxID=2675220 RepID=UPI0012E1F369|nr:S1/P1 nuclease [Sandarakinorhabdus oryzae]